MNELEELERLAKMLVEATGEDVLGGPLKALYLGVKAGVLSRQIEGSEKFMYLPDNSEVVQSLIKLRETEIGVLEKILKML